MPAQSPPVSEQVSARLRQLGEGVRTQREQQKISATALAEAAGMSRVTLHCIERGELSVTMGAYLSASDSLGLRLDLIDPRAPASSDGATAPELPVSVRLDDYPQLKRLAWQLPGVTELTAAEALSLYERNWRHIDPAGLDPVERALVRSLADRLGSGRLLV